MILFYSHRLGLPSPLSRLRRQLPQRGSRVLPPPSGEVSLQRNDGEGATCIITQPPAKQKLKVCGGLAAKKRPESRFLRFLLVLEVAHGFTSTAFWAWRRFSASSKMYPRGPRTPPAVISSPRWAGRQCCTMQPGLASAQELRVHLVTLRRRASPLRPSPPPGPWRPTRR